MSPMQADIVKYQNKLTAYGDHLIVFLIYKDERKIT
jgi:hypothetical protein